MPGNRTIHPMRISRDWILAILLAVLVALASYFPVWLAGDMAPAGRVFSGFLLNPIDGHTYLAKMHQGFEGAWRFQLDYAPEPGEAVFLYPYYLLLGHLAAGLGIELLDFFHVARVVMMALMLVLSFAFFNRFIANRLARWIAFGLTLIGSGLGWLGLAFGVEGSDLIIPESIPFTAGYANPHFSLAIGVVLLAILLLFSNTHRYFWRWSAAGLCGLVLAMVLPFSCLSLVLAVGAWLGWEAILGAQDMGWRGWVGSRKGELGAGLSLLAGMCPILIYDFWVVSQHPVISEWTVQNLTPSPPVISYLFGYGLVLLLALVYSIFLLRSGSMPQRFLTAWMMSGLVALYLPIGLQRRLSLGLFYPMVVLAVFAWERWLRRLKWGAILTATLLALSLPSNLIVIGAGLASVSSAEPLVTYPVVEQPAYSWISENVPADTLVLCSPQVGNRLPAYSAVRVLYGHPFETPQADTQKALVEDLLGYTGSPDGGVAQLLELGVGYVFFGPLERELGEPTWLEALQPVYQEAGVTIYAVHAP